MQTEVFITSEYITLGQFLKFENLIESAEHGRQTPKS